MDSSLLRTVVVFLDGAAKPLIVILGPTASGKTALSIRLAKHVGGEVVNADSRQLYRFLDIGTAKIKEEEKEGIPHHLLDILDPREESTMGRYQEKATTVINVIFARGKVPLLVGGSMLYISAITDALALGPAADPALHRRLMEEYDRDGGVKLLHRLQTLDPDAASGMYPRNRARLVRALEIYETQKLPKPSVRGELRPRNLEMRHASTSLAAARSAQHDIKKFEQKKCSYNLLIFGLNPSPDVLKRRMTERLDAMFAAGWIAEVRDLLARGYTADDPGMKSTGYREIIQYLHELEEGGSEEKSDAMQEALKKRILIKTRRYAKRQMAWWKGDERIRWIQNL